MYTTTGAKLTADALITKGVKYIFTLSGGHITPIYQYLEDSHIKLVDTRHEQAAVFMAEAYGRMKREPGVAMVTAGPGFTNALSAVSNARFTNAPLLIIAGAVGIDHIERLDLQDMRQLPVIEPMVKRAFVCHKPERAAEFVDMAWRTAISGRPGPVYLELPVDVLNAAVDDAPVKKPDTRIKSRPVDAEKAAQAIDMIKSAEKPVIIAGSGAWYSDAGPELAAFVEKTGIPAFTSHMGRGTISDTHPLCFESSLAIRPGASLAANMGADLVILLGTRMSLFYIFGDIFPPTAKLIQVDIEPEEIGRNRTIDLPVSSDIKAFLEQCIRLIDTGGEAGAGRVSRFETWVNELREAESASKSQAEKDWKKEDSPIHPMRLAWEVNQFMDREDDIVVADGGDTQIWMGMTRTVRQAGHYLDSGLFGCLAVGLPFANAAKLVHPGKRVCLIIGDGSVGFNFMEFESAVRHQLPIVVVISDDLGWGMIRHSQELRLGHAIEAGTYIGKVDYYKMVQPLGVKGYYVDRASDIRGALEEAFASGKPACIQVATDPTTVSPGSMALANIGGYKAN